MEETMPPTPWNEPCLDQLLTTPSPALIQDTTKINGDIIVLGAGGKMGPSLSVLLKNACQKAGIEKRITAVSRFTDPHAVALLNQNGVECIHADLLAPGAMEKLPNAANIIYMAGRKFGTIGQESLTWAMNTWLPALAAERYKESRIAVFSSGNVYPMVRPKNGGCDENTPPQPVGEYAMSTLGRERMFQYASDTYGTPVTLLRLNYAVDLRYGVLYDIAKSITDNLPIRITAPVFNCIWQGYANEIAIRSLLICGSPATVLNVTGPETVSVKWAARELGKHLGIEPIFEETEQENDRALINNASKMCEIFGNPAIGISQLIRMQAEWLKSGGRTLNKPTHFEERKGNF
jgi:nucleoside-diphosphate-sugar epimerase